MRAHLLKAITDVNGNLLAGAVVSLYQNGTGNSGSPVLITNPIYPAASGTALLSNPYTTPDGNINLYLDAPQRVDLGITPPGASPYVIADVDVLSVLAQAGQGLVATTPTGGFAKQNATPTIISWNVPNDGQPHRVSLYSHENVTTATETGGSVQLQYTGPAGTVVNTPVFTAGSAVGGSPGNPKSVPVLAGSVVSLIQNTALTAGGPTAVFAELWGS